MTLDEAIDEVLGKEFADQLRASPFSFNIVRLHTQACLIAFAGKKEGEAVEIVRNALIYMFEHNRLPPE